MTERQLIPEEQAREQAQRTEEAIQHGLRAWNDTIRTTADITFDMVEQSIQCSQKMVETYREFYQQGFNTWTHYLQQVNDNIDRAVSRNGDERRRRR
jgi:hypothetical protein